MSDLSKKQINEAILRLQQLSTEIENHKQSWIAELVTQQSALTELDDVVKDPFLVELCSLKDKVQEQLESLKSLKSVQTEVKLHVPFFAKRGAGK